MSLLRVVNATEALRLLSVRHQGNVLFSDTRMPGHVFEFDLAPSFAATIPA